MLTILRYGLKTTLDYRLYEKRFIYRQLLSIYDSKFSDYETKLSILELIKSTCYIKYALIDLIKRHYLIIWLTNTLIKQQEDEQIFHLQQRQDKQRKNYSNTQNLFYKLCEIYLLIWHQLDVENNEINENKMNQESEKEVKSNDFKPPILFLTQMFTLMRIFIKIFNTMVLNINQDDDLATHDSNIELNYDADDENFNLKLYQICFFKKFFLLINKLLGYFNNNSSFSTSFKLNEFDFNSLFKLINVSKYLYVIKIEYFKLIINSFDEHVLISNKKFLFDNFKFILNIISNRNLIQMINLNQNATNLFAYLSNMLEFTLNNTVMDDNSNNHVDNDDNDDYNYFYYQIYISITDFFANLNLIDGINIDNFNDIFDRFNQVFRLFLLEIKTKSIKNFTINNETSMEIGENELILFDKDRNKFLYENCYKFILNAYNNNINDDNDKK